MPDKDQFTRASNKCRVAARAIAQAIDTGVVGDGFHRLLAQAIESIWKLSGASSVLPRALQALQPQEEGPAPLWQPRHLSCDEVRDLVEDLPCESRVDKVIQRAALRELIGPRPSDADIVQRAASDLLRHFIIDADRGVLSMLGAASLHEHEAAIDSLLAPVVDAAARALVTDPQRRQLSIVQRFGLCKDPASMNLV